MLPSKKKKTYLDATRLSTLVFSSVKKSTSFYKYKSKNPAFNFWAKTSRFNR